MHAVGTSALLGDEIRRVCAAASISRTGLHHMLSVTERQIVARPVWVIRDRGSELCRPPTSASPRKLTSGPNEKLVPMGHVWTAPSWQGLSSRVQHWSVQPCVRPLSAVDVTAGHNALRGSGPGQKLAFDNALAHVGCPDRRIDRLCITCCSPSQPSHHAGYPV